MSLGTIFHNLGPVFVMLWLPPATVLSLHTSQVVYQAGAYPGFCNTKRLAVFLLPPGWDASTSQGYPQH